jgi:hypothetical protein
MKIIDLLADERRRLRWPTPECDAFSDVDALTEASLLDVRMDLINSTVGLMFDCRGALQIRQGNVAVVVIRGVSSCEWASVPRDGRSWRAVMAWQPQVSMTSLTVAASVEPAGRLRVVGTAGEFYVGSTPGGDAPPPDYTTASDAEVRAGMPHWCSDVNVLGATFVEQTS